MPSIGQYRNIVHDLRHAARFTGVNENGEAVYNNEPYPTVKFTGTVKVHGTNASYAYSESTGGYFQSKGNVLSIEKDNAGFCFFGTARVDKFQNLIDQIKEHEGFTPNPDTIITVYGEFAGGNIQKGVGVSGLEKMFILFGAKISNGDSAYWVETKHIECPNELNMYNINQFGTYEIEIDLEEPESAQNELIRLTHEVEALCPVAKFFGRTDPESEEYSVVGEGIVWECNFKDTTQRFKVKGEKHSTSKVKKLVSVDPEKVANVNEFVEYTVTENRLNQAIEQVFAGSAPLGYESTGDFIRWVKGDIVKEETDTLLASKLEFRDVAGPISKKAAKWYKDYINNLAM